MSKYKALFVLLAIAYAVQIAFPADSPTTRTAYTAAATAVRGLVEKDGKLWQPIEVTVRHTGPDETAIVRVDGVEFARQSIKAGSQTIELLVPPVGTECQAQVSIDAGGQTFTAAPVALKPVHKLTIYVLPHSHNDIGYTDLQPHVEAKQMENLRKGMEIARKTAAYPAGARFVWNMEVFWAADLWMRRMPEADRAAFMEAVRKGQVALNGLYANELTGLCGPEELPQLFRDATQFGERCGVKVDSAMLSDVPGMTWGTSTAMAHAGIRYFSLAPNFFDRIGALMVQWQDKPFWWVSPSGKDKVLVWVPWTGYAMSHIHKELTPAWVGNYQGRLDAVSFPYGISYIRWSGHGDNAEPDPEICEFIKTWNTKYAWPRFIISSTSQAFWAFEREYGDKLPQYKGDLTPYWEDGAGSSARETAMNRRSGERLVQSEALFAMLARDRFPADAFHEAWRNVLLYSEHTWGAWCSVSDSESSFTREQWAIKQAFATDADRQSRLLLDRALAIGVPATSAVDVFNTASWPRTQLVLVPRDLSKAGDHVTNEAGQPVPSQRLSTGELAVLARNVPPFAAARFHIAAGPTFAVEGAAVTLEGPSIDNGVLHARVDEKTGGIVELTVRDRAANFAQISGGEALNDYVYLPGDKLADLRGPGPVTITPLEKGPLVASLRIESSAPGCNRLVRELRLVAGADHLEITNTIDKQRVPLNPRAGEGGPGGPFAQRGSKESVSFAFPFNVPGGQIRLDAPLAVMRPEIDQLPGSCKDWLPVGRWADVSNGREGITLVTLDAPLVELGRLSTLLGSQGNPEVWRKQIEPTQRIYSWVMNNHWGTNYRAYQDGVTTFRYALRPHGAYDAADAARFATRFSQPLIVRAAAGPTPPAIPLLRVEPGDVLVTALKPSDDGKAWIVRLFGASGQDRQVKLLWSSSPPPNLSLSNLSEKPLTRAGDLVTVPGWGLVTLRAEPATNHR